MAAQQTKSVITSRTTLRVRPVFWPDDAGFIGSSPIVLVIMPPNPRYARLTILSEGTESLTSRRIRFFRDLQHG